MIGLLAALALAALPAEGARPLAVRAGRLYTAAKPGEVLEGVVLLVRDGKVAAIGREVEIPDDAEVLDARDAVVVPGLVAADSALAEAGRDAPESIGAHLRAIDGFDFYARRDRILRAGVTAAYVSPGRARLVSGRGAVVRLAGRAGPGRVLRAEADLRVNLAESAQSPPPIFEPPIPPTADDPILPARRQLPTARLGTLLALRRAIANARAYGEARAPGGPGRPDHDPSLEGLLGALSARLPLRIHATTALEIEQALEFLGETESRGILDGAAEAHRVAGAIARRGVPVVLDVPAVLGGRPIDPPRRRDAPETTVAAAARLEAAGVRLALAPPSDSGLEEFPALVGLAVQAGLDRDLALRAVTSEAASILGVGDRVGSLEVGKDADFVVLSGAPFEAASHALEVFVGGESVYRLARPRALVVRAGTVFTAAGPPIRDGAVLVEDGKVAAVGPTVPHPPGARVLDAGPRGFVAPGFVDGRSHLGLEGDRTAPAASLPIALVSAPGKKGYPEAAAAGVTTVLLAPAAAHANGSQVAAIKTGARTREDQIVKEVAAVFLPWRGGDRAARPHEVRELLKRAKDYSEKWDKYLEELKKGPETRKAPKEEPKEEVEKADPVTGTWEGTVTVPPFPQPIAFVVKMRLAGTSVSGTIRAPQFGDEEIPFSGARFEANRLTITVTTPMGSGRIDATLDREDHLSGTFSVAGFTGTFEANRTEKEPPRITVSSRRKKGPQEPPLDENLEPYRRLFKKEIVALVDAERTDEMEHALAVFAEHGLPIHFLGGEDGWRIGSTLAGKKVGVVVPPASTFRVDGERVNLPDRLARAGVAVGFRTDADLGAKDLALAAAWAVRQGMDPGEAIRALTIHPARMFQIDDRVGSIAPGKDGDLVVFSDDPFSLGARLLAVVANGEVLESAP